MPKKIATDEIIEDVVEETLPEQPAQEIEADEVDVEDGNQTIFPNGPTYNKVEEWKSLYKEIYLTEFDDDLIFVWRPLLRKEYKEIMKIESADQFYREERVCERCVLWPEGYSFMAMGSGRAGIPTFLSEQIIAKSGFEAQTTALKL